MNGHKFIKKKIPEIILNNSRYCINRTKKPFTFTYKICEHCTLEVIRIKGSFDIFYFDIFYFNGKEIFDIYGKLKELEITCNEFIIKNIIE
jgi:hypothetical protein